MGEVEVVGRDLGLELIAEEVRNVDGISRGIDALAAAHVEAINLLGSVIFYIARKLIIDRTRALRLPTIYWWADLVRDDGLIGYGPNEEEAARLHVQQVVRVLKGVAPGQLPVLQPTRFELVINLGTAKSIGVIIPQSLLALPGSGRIVDCGGRESGFAKGHSAPTVGVTVARRRIQSLPEGG